MKTFEGNLVAQNMKVGIVVSRFNEFITSRLLGARWTGLSAGGWRRRTSSPPGCPAPLRSR